MKTLLASAAMTAVLALPASAATIVGYTSSNSAGGIAPTTLDAGVTGLDLNRGTGLSQASGGTYNSRGWTESNIANALLDEDYLEFGFSSSDAYDLTSLDIRYDRSNTGPSNIELLASTDGFLFGSIFSDSAISASGELNSIDLSSFTNITNLTFRLVGWGATTSVGTFDIENAGSLGGEGIQINGELAVIAAVPLPAGLPLMLGGLGMLGLARRARKAR